MSDIQVAIVGTGFMGPVHREALARIGVPVRGILGSTPEKSERARTVLGLQKAYATFEEVLADDAVGAVHLCTPNLLHFDHARRALEAGKHVMCEKPLAMSTAETRELVRVAENSGLSAGVCYNLRYYPLHQHAASVIADGKLGRLFHINGCYVQDWLLYDTDYNWRLNAAESGALRVVADIGTHWMDLIETITGLSISAVHADLHTFHKTRSRPLGDSTTFSKGGREGAMFEEVAVDTEDYAAILFRFKGGAAGSLFVSQVAAGRKNSFRYEVSGSKAGLAWDGERPNEMWFGYRDRPNETLLKDPSLMAPAAAAVTSYPGGHAEGYPDTFKQCFKTFYDHIAHGGMPRFPGFAAGHRQVALCEAILQSSRTKTWISPEA